MYDRHLDTFIHVADTGSFLKAAEQLYISANAVTKQINLLEECLDVRLFSRSTQGLKLTEAGKLIYTEAKKMIRQSNNILKKAKELEKHHSYATIHVGVSLMNPATILLRHWNKASSQNPNIHLNVVPFEDTVPAFEQVLEHLGEKIDLVSCPYQTNIWGDRYHAFHLKDLPICISCAASHPLAAKNRLTIQDLYGETLILAKRGISNYQDPIRDEIEKYHLQIQIKDVEYVDLNLFNQVVSSKDLILSAECWTNVHPLLATIPVDWSYTLPYGLIYAHEPSPTVLQFIMAIGKVNEP